MVLEDITNEAISGPRSRRRSSTTKSTLLGLTPGQRSTFGADCETEESLGCSAATLIRRRSRLSYELIRRLSIELQKRRRETLPVIDSDVSVKEKRQRRNSSNRQSDVFDLLSVAKTQDCLLPKGYSMETLTTLTDARLYTIQSEFERLESQSESVELFQRQYGDDLQAALLKFLDTVVGCLLFVQAPCEVGVTSSVPLDTLLLLWVVPSHQERDLETKMLHWWLKTSVRSVKYFTVRSELHQVVQKEGFKQPAPQTEEKKSYLAFK